MKTEEQYHIDWLAFRDDQLLSKDLAALNVFISNHPAILNKWQSAELSMKELKCENVSFSDSFNSNVISLMRNHNSLIFDKYSLFVVSVGIAASILLMVNLFIAQSTWGFDALLGIADLDSNNTNLLFYINS